MSHSSQGFTSLPLIHSASFAPRAVPASGGGSGVGGAPGGGLLNQGPHSSSNSSLLAHLHSHPASHSSTRPSSARGGDRGYGHSHSHSHHASYLSTANNSQASSRAHSRPGSSNVSHLSSPRSVSPSIGMSALQLPHHAGAYGGASTPSSAQHSQQHSPQQQTMSLSGLPSVNRTLLQAPSLIVTPPAAASPAPVPSPSAVSSGAGQQSGGHTPSPVPPCCSGCTELRAENAQVRAQLLATSYELQSLRSSTKGELAKLRSDVTKALIAFESRLHLQLQQQLGFKPELEPMGIVAQAQQGSIVSQALHQIQAQLDKFEQRNAAQASVAQQQQQQQHSVNSASVTGANTPGGLLQPATLHLALTHPHSQNPSPGGSPWTTNPSSKRGSWDRAMAGGGTGPLVPQAMLNPQPQSAPNLSVGWADSVGNMSANAATAGGAQQALSPPQIASALLPGLASGHPTLLSPTAASTSTSPTPLVQQQHQQQQAALLANLASLGNLNLANLSHLLNALQPQLNVPGASSHALSQLSSLLHAAGGGSSVHAPHAHHGGGGGHHHHHSGSSSISEERLILLTIEILSVHGAVPVGKLGSLLHKLANDHTLPQMLKERYGGLKKWLACAKILTSSGREVSCFTLGTDHPYNPAVCLSADFLAATPHIRPPEPAAPPTLVVTNPSGRVSPAEAALPPILNPDGTAYQGPSYFGGSSAGSVGSTVAGSSLLSPLSSTSSALHREFSGASSASASLSNSGHARDASLDPSVGVRSVSAASVSSGGVSDRASHSRPLLDADGADYLFDGDEIDEVISELRLEREGEPIAPHAAASSDGGSSAASSSLRASDVGGSNSGGSSREDSVAATWEKVSNAVVPSASPQHAESDGSDEARDASSEGPPLPLPVENSPSLGSMEPASSAFFSKLLS